MKKSTFEKERRLFPAGYTQRNGVQSRRGSLSFATHEDPASFWITAKGMITPALIKEELFHVEEFARDHPEGWSYIVDTTRVTLIHPWNPMLLRRVKHLPHLSRYIVIAPPAVRFLSHVVSWLIRPTHIIGTESEALEILAAPVVSELGKL